MPDRFHLDAAQLRSMTMKKAKGRRDRLPPHPGFPRLGPGLLTGKGAAQTLLEPAHKGRRTERPSGAFVGTDQFTLAFRQRLRKEGSPVVHAIQQRPYADDLVVSTGEVRTCARPAVVARAF